MSGDADRRDRRSHSEARRNDGDIDHIMKHFIILALIVFLGMILVVCIWLMVLFPAALRTYCP